MKAAEFGKPSLRRMRYVISHVSDKTGLRILTLTNQGRYHFDEREDAEQRLALLEPDLRRKVLSETEADSLEVREVECYDHGDAVGTVLGD